MTGHVTDPAEIRAAWDDDEVARSDFADTLAVVHARHAAIRATHRARDEQEDQ